MPEFVHLHNHTHYSLLDGACTPQQLIDAALADGHKAVALTDHGVMFGSFEFYKKARKSGIKPILGCEAYVANGARQDRNLGKGPTKRKNYFHLVLLAKDLIGYKNLLKLTSLGHTEGFYYKPRIDRELLEKHHEGLVALSACAGGVVNSHIVNGDLEAATEAATWYKDLFGDDFYIELQDHTLPVDEPILEHAPKIARDLGIKMVATNDCHYIKQEHAVPHNVHLYIKDITASTAGTVDIEKLRYGAPEMYFKSTDQMVDLFKDYKGAIENSVEISEKCNLELPDDLYFPEFPIPEEAKAATLDDYLEELTFAGLERRFGDLPPETRERADFELNVIKTMGYAGYFLITQDFIAAARRMGVRVGPGRGSAAGSLVAYGLEITNVDPLKYDLLFERFLNPDRVSMPDIDIDFSDDKRDRVIQYCREKYGEDSVAQIITFGTLSSRAVLKDVGRVLGIPLSTITSITEKIPVTFGKVASIKDALELPELRWLKESGDKQLRKLVEVAMVLEGFCRNASLHAAGVVIAPGPVNDYVPLYKSPNSELCTQYNMKDLEDAGLLKMDFLGLRTLSIIDRTLEIIKHNHDTEIDPDDLDLFDKKTYELLGRGKTVAIFQFESEPMQQSLRKLRPSSLEDLTAMNALYRPGPMANIPDFIARKRGQQEITYLHDIMKPALEKTYGIIVYQEQVMQLVRDIAGFSLAQADIMRRAMGKKDEKLMQEQKVLFVEGAVKNNIEKKKAEEIFDLILKFAAYGFNKSHALAYSYLAYQTAWLKAHYTPEFLAANMTAELHNLDKVVQLIDDAKSFGINVLPPDVNESDATFTAVGTSIRFGLAAIKNLGIGPVESIINARLEKPFESFFDFVARVDTKILNRRALEALVCAGAFDFLKQANRAQLFEAIDEALKYAQAASKSNDSGMDSLFGDDSEAMTVQVPELPDIENWNHGERLKREREYLNFYVSGHPLERYWPHVQSFSTLKLGERSNPVIGNQARVCGIVTGIRKRLDKRERTIAFVMIEDFTGKAECIFWSKAFADFQHLLVEDAILMVIGKSEMNGSDSLKVIADEVLPIEKTPERFSKGMHVSVTRDKTTVDDLQRAQKLIAKHKGNQNIEFSVYEAGESLPVKRFRSFESVTSSNDLATGLMSVFGHRNIRFLRE